MTSVATSLALPGAPVVTHLLELTADTLHDAVRATRAGDRPRARQICRARARRRAVRAVRDALHRAARTPPRRLTPGRLGIGGRTEQLAFVDQLLTLNKLLDLLTARVASGVSDSLSAADSRSLELLGHAGSERLLRLAAGLDEPGADAAFRRCGDELFTVLDHLTARHAWPTTTTDTLGICGDIAFALLATSRSR